MTEDTTASAMARRHVEILKRARAAFHVRDFEALMPLFSEDMELHPAIGGAFVGVTTYRGRDGMRRYWEDIMEVIEDFQVEPLSYSSWRDYLIVPNRVSGYRQGERDRHRRGDDVYLAHQGGSYRLGCDVLQPRGRPRRDRGH